MLYGMHTYIDRLLLIQTFFIAEVECGIVKTSCRNKEICQICAARFLWQWLLSESDALLCFRNFRFPHISNIKRGIECYRRIKIIPGRALAVLDVRKTIEFPQTTYNNRKIFCTFKKSYSNRKASSIQTSLYFSLFIFLTEFGDVLM